MTGTARPIMLAAGGTGGHMFPAEALARELGARGIPLALVTDRRGQEYGGALASVAIHRVRAGGLAGRSPMQRLRAVFDLLLGTVESILLLWRLRPAAVVGFGGYPSLPPMLAAILARVPTALHEQNAVLGRANRVLAPRVARIATAFPRVANLPVDADAVCTGMPVRAPILAVREAAYAAPEADGPVRILVLGGSQGAHVFSEVVPAALKSLPAELRRRIVIAQQCRPEDLEAARAAYAGSEIAAELAPFFRDVPERLAVAHLVIARAGASTVAELAVAGRPAVLVPFPFAIDDHQTGNAHAMAEAGGAWLMPQGALTPESLAERLRALIAMPGMLDKAAACARAVGRPDAAARLADAVLGLIAGAPSAAARPLSPKENEAP